MEVTAGPAMQAEGWARLALALLLAFGVLFAFVTPPFQVPDEPEHFFRAFEISEGRLVSVTHAGGAGDFLPYSLPQLAGRLTEGIPFHPDRRISLGSIREGLRQRIQPDRRIFVGFMTSGYSFVPYLPAASGIALARLFSDSVLACLYAGRLANVVVAAVLLAAAIGAAPVGSVVLFLLALLPTAVFLMASVSADALTNALCFCWIALVLRFAFGGRRLLERRDLAGAVLLAGVLGLTKAGYVLLPSLMWAVPSERFGSRSRRALWVGLFQAAALASLIGWTLRIRRVYPRFDHGGDLARVSQLRGMIAHPLRFAELAISQLVQQGPSLANQYIAKLGWIDTRLPAAIVVTGFAAVVLVALTCGDGLSLRLRQRLVLLAVLVASVVWIAALLYVVVSPYGARVIVGLQGRYLIPLGPLAFLPLSNGRWRIDWDRRRGPLAAWAAIFLCVALAATVARFYR